jgi:hypothetical protein
MELLVAAIFGLSLGHLVGAADPSGRRWTPTVAAGVILGVVAYESIAHHPDRAWAGVVIAFSVVLGSLLTEAAALRDHPLTTGMGFATRVRFALTQRRLLREHEQTSTEAEPASRIDS